MKSYLTFAWKELKTQHMTAALILIAVILSTIMTTVLGQSLGILQSMRITQAAYLNGNRYAAFHQLTAGQTGKLHEDDRLYDVGDILNVGNMPLGNSSLTLYLREYHENALAMYPSVCKVKEGRLPEKAKEIALPEDALAYLNLDAAVGDTISLVLSAIVQDGSIPRYDYSADFALTGILESSYLGYSTGIVDGIVGNGTAKKLLPEEYLLYSVDFKTHSRADFQAIVDDLAASLGLDEFYIQYNEILLDALGISYRSESGADLGSGFSFMTFACVLVGVLILFAAGLVIYNVLKISVAKRIKGYGILRAIGGEKGQIYRLVSLQLFILCGAGIPPGLLLGVLSAKGVLTAATGILNPEVFLANSTEELNAAIRSAGAVSPLFLLISSAVTLLSAMAASLPAAWYASRVSPTMAMSGLPVKVERKVGVRRKELSVAVMSGQQVKNSQRKRTVPRDFSATPMSSRLIKIRRSAGKPRKIHSFEAWYARLNLRRGRGRTVITILSLVMSITVFVALQSFTSLLDASAAIKDLHTGDYSVTNETAGISEEAVDSLRRQDFVESLATTKMTVCDPLEELPFDTDLMVQSHETLQIVSLDENRFFSSVSELTEQDREDLRAGIACLVKNPIEFAIGDVEVEYTSVRAGDVLTFNENKMRVAGILDFPVTINNAGFTNGVQVIVADSVYNSIVGSSRYSEIYPTLKKDADAEKFESWLDDFCAENPGTHWLSYRMSDEQAAESFEKIRLLCWILISFVGLIGVLNIINTVYNNIHTRISEIGMQRAIGMSRRSLYWTFLWEGAYYGIYASVIGAALGYICTIFIEAGGTDHLRFAVFPVLSVCEAALVSVAACLLATAIPLRAVERMSIVESIEAVE